MSSISFLLVLPRLLDFQRAWEIATEKNPTGGPLIIWQAWCRSVMHDSDYGTVIDSRIIPLLTGIEIRKGIGIIWQACCRSVMHDSDSWNRNQRLSGIVHHWCKFPWAFLSPRDFLFGLCRPSECFFFSSIPPDFFSVCDLQPPQMMLVDPNIYSVHSGCLPLFHQNNSYPECTIRVMNVLYPSKYSSILI